MYRYKKDRTSTPSSQSPSPTVHTTSPHSSQQNMTQQHLRYNMHRQNLRYNINCQQKPVTSHNCVPYIARWQMTKICARYWWSLAKFVLLSVECRSQWNGSIAKIDHCKITWTDVDLRKMAPTVPEVRN